MLRADSICKWFGDRAVLTSATLRSEGGRIGYLVGRNGCGKTTLLRIAVGEVEANSGTVHFKGEAFLRPHLPTLATRGLFFLPDRDILSPGATPRMHMQSIARQFGCPDYLDVIEPFALEELLDRRCGGLSTGERRRVEVATALVRRPACLVADEPFRNIDPNDREIIAAALRRVATGGCAVVISGHEVEELLALADSVTWCTDGTTYELGPPASAVNHERFRATYLGEIRAARIGVA